MLDRFETLKISPREYLSAIVDFYSAPVKKRAASPED